MATPDWINPDAVRLLVGGLIGKQVPARLGPPLTPSPETPMAIAVYVTDKNEIGGLVYCDVPLAASIGASFILLPPGATADAVKGNKVPENLAENCREVLNVAARWFNAPPRPHVRLADVAWNQTAMPPELASYAQAANTRIDVSLAIPGYPVGTLTILAA